MRCVGCGAELQFSYEDKEGYIDFKKFNALISIDKQAICKRCFSMVNYNIDILDHNNIPNKTYNFELLNSRNNIIVYIIDAINLEFYIPELTIVSKNTTCKLVIIVNKFDLLKNFNLENKIKEHYSNEINKIKINYEKIFFVSAFKKSDIDELANFFLSFPPLIFFNFVGPSSAGKSYLIDKIYEKIVYQKTSLTTSVFLKTTLYKNVLRLPNNSKFVDYYGFTRKDDLRYYLNNSNFKKVYIEKSPKLIGYQIKDTQSILIEGAARFDFFGEDIISFITLCNSNLKIHKTSIRKKSDDLIKKFDFPSAKENELLGERISLFFELKKTNAYDIIIFGLGVFRVMNCSKIIVEISQKINVLLRESLL